MKKPLKEIGYSQEEYQILADGFAGVMKGRWEKWRENKESREGSSVTGSSTLERYLQYICDRLFTGVFSGNAAEKRAAEQYICGAIPDIAARIKNGITYGCLDQVFRV
ncbi:hypothetical protein [Clostridium sp. AN503]|uniref:hypothetical protein n=1 Tax=Clostridium sp. AN503 TaxID=3160598 RepID=UPI003457CACC